MKRTAVALLAVLLAGCRGATVLQPEPELRVEVTLRYVNPACTIRWTATANLPLRVIQYSVGFGDIDNPRWVRQGAFQGSVTEEFPKQSRNVTYLFQADGYRRAANSGVAGLC